MLVLLILIGVIVFSVLSLLISPFLIYIKNHDKVLLCYSLFLAIVVLTSIISWFFNLGLTRIFIFIPMFIYFLILIMISLFTLKFISKSKKIRIFSTVLYSTYIVSCLTLPDRGFHGEYCAFFRLIENELALSILAIICLCSAIINIVTLIILFLEANKTPNVEPEKKEIKSKVEEEVENVSVNDFDENKNIAKNQNIEN